MEAELHLRIVLEKPPAGVDFGLQEGKGHAYKTVRIQRDLRLYCDGKKQSGKWTAQLSWPIDARGTDRTFHLFRHRAVRRAAGLLLESQAQDSARWDNMGHDPASIG
jgi:hypothetical protein